MSKLVRWHFLFEPRDLWVGLYWTRGSAGLFVYVCVVPMFPLRMVFR